MCTATPDVEIVDIVKHNSFCDEGVSRTTIVDYEDKLTIDQQISNQLENGRRNFNSFFLYESKGIFRQAVSKMA